MLATFKSPRTALAALAISSAMLAPVTGFAAGGPYAVDDAAVLDAGTCQVDAFASFGDESREAYVLAPSCVSGFAPWLEAGVAVERAHEGGAWGTVVEPGLKAVFGEIEEAGLSFGLSSGLVYDRAAAADHFVWGAGTVFQANENLAFIAETFGQDEGKTVFQAGFRPTIFNGRVDLDFVDGSNITGESGNWFSAGTSVRF